MCKGLLKFKFVILVQLLWYDLTFKKIGQAFIIASSNAGDDSVKALRLTLKAWIGIAMLMGLLTYDVYIDTSTLLHCTSMNKSRGGLDNHFIIALSYHFTPLAKGWKFGILTLKN
jgi:hypothetical protein